jgi:4-hydroxy-tetrahydrodipicolinate reductase
MREGYFGAIKAAEIVFERKEKGQKGLITSFFE